MICGIDEVGRGPWAGPMVVGAVVLNGATIVGLTDSKKLTKLRRERIASEIIESQASIGLGWVHAEELDALGMSASLVEATKRAVSQIDVPYHEIIIDGTVNFLADTNKSEYVTTLKKADLLIASVSAASIVAKVARDEYMIEQAELYPDFGFGSHMGYGTVKHRTAIESNGITPLHRLSFAPLARFRADTRRVESLTPRQMTTSKQIGDQSELLMCQWLERNGYNVIEQNWKTKFCEIDIIATKASKLYFVEVKHRRSSDRGGGVAAITNDKLRKMRFASEVYVQYNRLHAVERQLAVATTSGEDVRFESFMLIE